MNSAIKASCPRCGSDQVALYGKDEVQVVKIDRLDPDIATERLRFSLTCYECLRKSFVAIYTEHLAAFGGIIENKEQGGEHQPIVHAGIE